MKNTKSMIKVRVIIWFLFICLFMTGCSKKNENGQQNAQLQALKEKQTQEKESKKLKAIEADIEAVFEVLGGPSVKMEESKSEKDSEKQSQQTTGEQQKTEQQQSGQQQGGQQQGGQQQGGQQQGTQQQGTKQEQQGGQQQGTQQAPDKWSEVDKLIQKLHYKWNDFIPDLSKKGADIKLIDNFDNALNQLTTTISSKDKEKVLTSANTLYSHIPDLYSLYRIKLSPEAKRMVYYTRSIILESAKDNWPQVVKDNETIEKSWSLFRNTLESKQKETGDKLNFSIYELKKVSVEKNKQLTDIKGKIVLDNIKELQKTIEEKK